MNVNKPFNPERWVTTKEDVIRAREAYKKQYEKHEKRGHTEKQVNKN
jgi:hypothetical protein